MSNNDPPGPSLPDRTEWKAIFQRLDINGDGRISVKNLCLELELTENDLNRILGAANLNGKTYLTYDEFEKAMNDANYEKKIMLAAFQKFDLDGNGFITKAELKTVLMKRRNEMNADEEADLMITDMDLDGDGMISYKEFVENMYRVPDN